MRETTNEKQKKKQNHTQAAEQQAEVCMLLYTQMWPVCLLAKHAAIVSHNEIELRLFVVVFSTVFFSIHFYSKSV